jgi:hypothetical protein
MKLTREQARKEGARLQASVMLAPQSDEGRREIVDCLLRNCQDARHAAEVITAVLDDAIRPQNLTAEIAAIARRCQHPELAPPGCDLCALGEDLGTGAMRWAPFVSIRIRGYECAQRCTCARGRWLASKDEEREQERTEAGPHQRQLGIVPAAQVDVKVLAANGRE